MYNQAIAPDTSMAIGQLPPANTATTIQYCREPAGQLYLREHAVLFICQGRWCIEHGDHSINAGPQQVVFLRKHILVRNYVTDVAIGEEPAILLLTLTGGCVREFVKQASLQEMRPLQAASVYLHQPGPALLSCLKSVESYCSNGALMTEALVRLKVQELLHCLQGHEADRPMLEQLLDLRETYRSDITDIIEQNLTNTISLVQLARMSGRSLSSFRRDFLAIYNMPPSKWIRLRRLEKSLELLTGTRMSVTDVCYTLGFENIAHFSRLFKARFGVAPSAYRNGVGTPSFVTGMINV